MQTCKPNSVPNVYASFLIMWYDTACDKSNCNSIILYFIGAFFLSFLMAFFLVEFCNFILDIIFLSYHRLITWHLIAVVTAISDNS